MQTRKPVYYQIEMARALTLVLMFSEELEDLLDSAVHACLSELQ